VFYYKVAVIGSVLEPLTYHFSSELSLGSEVVVLLQNKEKKGVVVEHTTQPTFKTLSIINTTQFFYTQQQRKLASFISSYYFCSVAEAFGLMRGMNLEVKMDEFEYENSWRVVLSNTQEKVFQELQKSDISLLFGDTGSGKIWYYVHICLA
jgi:primosomal protein N' (replication factor Y)